MNIFKNRLLSGVAFSPFLSIDREGDDQGGGGGNDDLNLQLDEGDDQGAGDDQDEGDDQGAEEGADDAEGSEGDEEGDDEGGDDAGGEPRGRANRDVSALRADRRRLADENARLTRQLSDMQRGGDRSPPPAAAETPQQRAERLALLSPAEQAAVIVEESLARHQQQNNALMGQLMDQSDRTTFQGLCERNPLAKKLSGQVETELAQLRQKGQNLPREAILTYLLGQRLLAQNGAGRQNRQQRRQQQRVPARNPQGDVRNERPGRRRTGDAAADFESRFGDHQI